LYQILQSLIDAAVPMLIPLRTCTEGRWVTFYMEGKTNERHLPRLAGETVQWAARYNTGQGYVTWQTLNVTGHPQVKVSSGRNSTEWIPAICVDGREILERAPHPVLAEGCHDSCWRDNAFKGGRLLAHLSDITVTRITVSGPVAPGMNKEGRLKNGEWVNEAMIPGPEPLLKGISILLSKVAGKDRLTVELDSIWQKGAYGKRGFKETRIQTHLGFNGGLVVEKGREEGKYRDVVWEKTDPTEFVWDSILKYKDGWVMTHCFPDLS
jgi:hypothetical protein